MSFTQEQLDALRAARATGALEVSQGNERVRYRSLAELDRVITRAEAALAGTGTRRPTHFQPVFDRGA